MRATATRNDTTGTNGTDGNTGITWFIATFYRSPKSRWTPWAAEGALAALWAVTWAFKLGSSLANILLIGAVSLTAVIAIRMGATPRAVASWWSSRKYTTVLDDHGKLDAWAQARQNASHHRFAVIAKPVKLPRGALLVHLVLWAATAAFMFFIPEALFVLAAMTVMYTEALLRRIKDYAGERSVPFHGVRKLREHVGYIA